MTADDAVASVQERLIKAIHAATFYDEDGSEFGTNALNDGAEEQLADALLAAGFGDVAEAKASALEEASEVARSLLYMLDLSPEWGGLVASIRDLIPEGKETLSDLMERKHRTTDTNGASE